MTAWLIAVAAGVAAALLQYALPQARGPAIGARVGMAALRAIAVALLVALLLDAPIGAAQRTAPWVFVDGSASMERARSGLYATAWDTARAVPGADSTFVFGDSLRAGRDAAPASDNASRLRRVVERTMAAGRPVVLVTDGEVADSAALDGLPTGSRVVVLERPASPDAALVTFDAPRAVVEGDSIYARVLIRAGAGGAGAGHLTLALGERQLGRWPLEALPAWGERQLDLRARAAGEGNAILRAVLTTAGDVEPRNDTIAAAMELSRAASAVFVSTSPDQDARFAMAVLRGALALPTRGFLRVAPGLWRQEGSLAPATETDVREALRSAPVAILHGDTALLGAPRSITLGPLALIVPAPENAGEWYVTGAPPSPLSAVLAGLPVDSLPPIAVGASPAGDWVALEARRGREPTRRPVIAGTDEPRRVAIVSGSGFWRWHFRRGASADAYVALWGGIFDWLAAERADRRAAVPDENVARAGEPIRWRRGSSADSVVRIALTRLGGETDTIALRFAAGVSVQESAPLDAGIYEAVVPGGRSLLAVNVSQELLPTRPVLRSERVGRAAAAGAAPGARSSAWPYIVIVLLLCAEWFFRRRAGLR